MNGDGLDPKRDLDWWNLGYLYPPTLAVTQPSMKYVRHSQGGNYAWVDGHVSFTSWTIMSAGANGRRNWFYLARPQDPD